MEEAGAIAVVVMNSEPSWMGADDLIEMGKAEKSTDISISSIFISYASGTKILAILQESNASLPVVAINATGEEILLTPTFWDMFVTFLQLSIVLWLSILILYGCALIGGLYQRYRRRKACKAIPTVQYKSLFVTFSISDT